MVQGYEDTPSDKLDVWGFATHEFGHATGWGSGGGTNHFPDSWGVCVDAAKHTMCDSMAHGENHWRSLEEHDRDTYNNVYN